MEYNLEKLLISHGITDETGNSKLALEKSDADKFAKFIEGLREHQTELSESNKLLRLIIDTVPCTISLIDSDLKYVGANQPLADLCNHKIEELIGQDVGFYTNNKFIMHFARNLFLKAEERSKQKLENKEVPTMIDGLEKTFWISGTKLHNQNMAVIIGVDITTLKNLENRVHLTEKLTALGEMVAGIVHDIKSPLQLISLSARKIKKSKEITRDQTNSIEKIEKTTDRILKIVSAIKVFARDETKDEKTKENIYEIFQDALEICEHRLKEQNVKLTVTPPSDNFSFYCYPTKIFQVFVNLVNNSMDAISQREDQWINIQFNENQITLTDSGEGIPSEIRQNIFDAFFTTKEAGVGSGLGLSMCKKILLEIEGDIVINSDCQNTQFIITLKSIT